jgi:RNA polymerase sigma-70 factor (ECF subfamily)
MGSDSELELIDAAREGDRDAADALLSRYELVVHRTCRHLLPVGEDVEAAVQETFLKALLALDRYSGQGSFGGWIATIAVNLCRDRLRRRKLVPFVALENTADDEAGGPLAVLPGTAPDPERVAMARQAMRRVRREVALLPDRQREVFTLRFFVGLELEPIAQALGVDVGTVKTHLHRAVRRVREAAVEAVP